MLLFALSFSLRQITETYKSTEKEDNNFTATLASNENEVNPEMTESI
jgi:hypothetical protein